MRFRIGNNCDVKILRLPSFGRVPVSRELDCRTECTQYQSTLRTSDVLCFKEPVVALTVIVYLPVGVPGSPEPASLLLSVVRLPQPASEPTRTAAVASPGQCLRPARCCLTETTRTNKLGRVRKRPYGQGPSGLLRDANIGAVVEIATATSVTLLPGEICNGVNEHALSAGKLGHEKETSSGNGEPRGETRRW